LLLSLLRSVFVKEERERERERERDYVFIIIIKLSKAFFVQRQQRVKHPFLLLPLTTEEDVFFLKTFFKRDFEDFFQERFFCPHKTNKKRSSFEEEEEEDKKKKTRRRSKKKNASSEKKWHRLHLTSTSWQKKPSPPKSEKKR